MQLPFLLEYKPELGTKTDYGIGIVGAGSIVEVAHLPAYRKAAFSVVGICDTVADRACLLAEQFGIPKVYHDLAELLADPQVEIVDIAVPPWAQPTIANRALESGKHLLCQKPLAANLEDAGNLVEKARRLKRQLAVNENMRWDPAMRASHSLIKQGWIGQPVMAALDVNYKENWASWPWLMESPRLTILFDSIHPLYCFRMLFGEPERVYCVTARAPGQLEKGETRAVVSMEFAGGVSGLLLDCSTNPTDDHFATFRFDGTEGSIKGTLGIWYDIPFGRPDSLDFTSAVRSPGVWFSPRLEGRWVPDAFIGPMAALMKSIEDGSEPENSGREHLKTLQLVEAAYRAAVEKRAISLEEITLA